MVLSRATRNKLISIPVATRRTAQAGFVSLRALGSSVSLLDDLLVSATVGGVEGGGLTLRGVVGRSLSGSMLAGFNTLESWLRIDGGRAGQETKVKKETRNVLHIKRGHYKWMATFMVRIHA
jgi:hypothetical protein